ncbi:hypothetical protein OG426_43300 [Streptomyces canus]|uniref:hypothetical protein n=1 Tax=Streptomyces canus TaxID=58343 RepID=UPI003867535D|nr:hypothetical protein OG426_43300 [Streptomyces canus]
MELKTWLDSGVSAGTLVLAGCTALLAKRTKEAVEESSRARQVWESMAADATRARLDAAAPAVNVFVHSIPDEIYGQTQGANSYDNEWPTDRLWTIPRDNNVKVAIKCFAVIENNSHISVEITCTGPFWSQMGRGDHSFILESDEKTIVQLVAAHTVAEWLENYDTGKNLSSVSGSPRLVNTLFPYVEDGVIVMSDRNASGVSDTWLLNLTGAPIERNGLNAGEARKSGAPVPAQLKVAVADLSDRHRTYFLSRKPQSALPGSRPPERGTHRRGSATVPPPPPSSVGWPETDSVWWKRRWFRR